MINIAYFTTTTQQKPFFLVKYSSVYYTAFSNDQKAYRIVDVNSKRPKTRQILNEKLDADHWFRTDSNNMCLSSIVSTRY